ncbi:MAG: hypothetical protein AAFR17_18240, partial [Pseudomonadota bacterium]
SLAVPLDARGEGYLMLQGFEQSSPAELRLSEGQVMSFDLPFSGTDKVSRVGLVWDDPIDLNLHALEFGARPFSPGNVYAENARTFSEVRRGGGGYLTVYAPVDGIGQHAEIYSHVLRQRGQSGVVDLVIDFASRTRDRLAETCSGGAYARPTFKLLRTEQGVVERARMGRLAGLECAEIPRVRDLAAADEIGSLIVSP